MLLKDFVNKKIASADKEVSAEGVPLTLNNCKKYKKMRDLKVYGNSVQDTATYGTPSVDNPVEIESVGELVTDEEYELLTTLADTTVSFTDAYYRESKVGIILEPETTYMISFDYMINANATGATVRTVVGYGESYDMTRECYSKNYPNQNIGELTSFECVFTTPSVFTNGSTGEIIDIPYLFVRFAGCPTVNTVSVSVSNRKIAKLPHYGKYKIPIVQRGIHIVNPKSFVGGSMTDNGDETYTLHWTSSNRFSRNNTECSKIPVGSKIYVSASIVDDNLNNSRLGVMLWHTDNTQSYWQITKTWSPTFTVTKPIYYITLYINSEEEMGAWITFKDLIVCYSDEFSGYEPYVEPITTNIYLDEPLRKLSSYADYIDGKNDKVVRKCCKRNLASYTYSLYEKSVKNGVEICHFHTGDRAIIPSSYYDVERYNANVGKSNVMPTYNDYNYAWYTYGMIMWGWGQNIRFAIPTEYIGEATSAAFESWVNEHNAYMVRVLATPKEEPLNIDLPKLNAKTTIIEVDTSLLPSNISGKYILR